MAAARDGTTRSPARSSSRFPDGRDRPAPGRSRSGGRTSGAGRRRVECATATSSAIGAYALPELLATGPRELWSWDITKLKGPAKWTWFQLYVILDVFSRYVPGWMVATRESAELACRLIADTARKQGIEPGRLTVHADRGSSMASRPVALLLADLGISKSHSRPHVSNDNPYSEAGFKTLKYRPTFPTRFGSIEDARAFCAQFFAWYNTAHRHSRIGMYTPADVHHGWTVELSQVRTDVLAGAYAAHPERFVGGLPTPRPVPAEVWINRPAKEVPRA